MYSFSCTPGDGEQFDLGPNFISRLQDDSAPASRFPTCKIRGTSEFLEVEPRTQAVVNPRGFLRARPSSRRSPLLALPPAFPAPPRAAGAAPCPAGPGPRASSPRSALATPRRCRMETRPPLGLRPQDGVPPPAAASRFTFTSPTRLSLAVTAGSALRGWLCSSLAYAASGLLMALQPCPAPRDPPPDTPPPPPPTDRGEGVGREMRRGPLAPPGRTPSPGPSPRRSQRPRRPSDTADAPGPGGLYRTDVALREPQLPPPAAPARPRTRAPGTATRGRRSLGRGGRLRVYFSPRQKVTGRDPNPLPASEESQSRTSRLDLLRSPRAAGPLLNDTKGKPCEPESPRAAHTGAARPPGRKATGAKRLEASARRRGLSVPVSRVAVLSSTRTKPKSFYLLSCKSRRSLVDMLA